VSDFRDWWWWSRLDELEELEDEKEVAEADKISGKMSGLSIIASWLANVDEMLLDR
jgi:hypothetical protein